MIRLDFRYSDTMVPASICTVKLPASLVHLPMIFLLMANISASNNPRLATHFSSDTLKTFTKLGTSQFKGYFVFTKLIDGFLYGSRDNGIYRLKVESPAVHEEITNNYRGAESNFFSFSNDDLFVENNPVWSFDTNDEIWTKGQN